MADPAVNALAERVDAKTAPFLLLGDGDHGDPNIIGFLARDGVMPMLKEKGYENLFLEIRHEFQPLADKVAHGEMTPQEYAQAKSDMYKAAGYAQDAGPTQKSIAEAEVIQAAAAQGINVYCAESQAADLKAHREFALRVAQNDAALAGAEQGILQSKFAGNTISVSDPKLASAFEARQQDVAERTAGDITLAEFIAEKSAGAPSIVMYGANHGSRASDLDEHLGAKRIGLHSTLETAVAFGERAHLERGQTADALVVSTGTFLPRAVIDNIVASGPQLDQSVDIQTAPPKPAVSASKMAMN